MAQFQINKSTYNIYKYTAVLSCAVIMLLGMVFLQPFSFSENTNATTERTTNGDYYLETTATDLNLTIKTTPAGAQETASHDVTVKTDDPAGYTLTVSVNNDTSNALNLNGNTSATEKFNATSGTYASPKALDENSWGFADTLAKKNNDQWAAVPLLSNAQQLKQTSSANTSGDTATVHYAINAKYDGQHSNGNYSNTVVYSVTGNTIPAPDLSSVTYMHEATSQLCTDSKTFDSSNVSGTEYELTDARTNEKYWVRKFSDGNCWMVENLYLPAGTTISTTNNYSKVDFNYPATSSTGTWPNAANGAMIANGSRYRTSNSGNYDGTYMNWYTATAGTGGDYGTNKAATTDICPTYWRLPTNAENSKMNSAASDAGGITSFYANFQGASVSPIRPGYYGGGGLADAGSYAYWWSIDRNYANGNVNSAYVLLLGNDVSNTSILSTSSRRKSYGFSVRCVLASS